MAKTAAEKLGIKAGCALTVINPPADRAALLGTLPPSVTEQPVGTGTADVVVLFAQDSAQLHQFAPKTLAAAKSDGKVWIAYRKGGVSDLSRDALMPALVDAGWHGVSLVSLDDKWSAARFRPLDQIGR
ncbi:MAG TPA: hypothetical protein VGX23_30690 [Actinocrinis sp.]|nr:hypothetical protein [Actinocrinis sp.]